MVNADHRVAVRPGLVDVLADMEYSHYTIIMNHVVAVNDYKKDNQTGDYILAQNTLVIMPDTNKLMTMK